MGLITFIHISRTAYKFIKPKSYFMLLQSSGCYCGFFSCKQIKDIPTQIKGIPKQLKGIPQINGIPKSMKVER